MAYIVKTKDPFHPREFVCSNCYNFLFMYGQHDTSKELSFLLLDKHIQPLKHFPTFCNKCLEELELKDGILDFTIPE